jgi:hypothetical protein
MPEVPKKFVPEMHLVLHGRIPVTEKIEGEELYHQIKEILTSFSPKCSLFGQITETLEPCCNEKPITKATVGIPLAGARF